MLVLVLQEMLVLLEMLLLMLQVLVVVVLLAAGRLPLVAGFWLWQALQRQQ